MALWVKVLLAKPDDLFDSILGTHIMVGERSTIAHVPNLK